MFSSLGMQNFKHKYLRLYSVHNISIVLPLDIAEHKVEILFLLQLSRCFSLNDRPHLPLVYCVRPFQL